jgi:nicotinamide mononucleotide adenylyltransferase
MKRKVMKDNIKYGIFLGRVQPFHFGHQNVVNEILLDGLKPLICVGSINDDRDLEKNPLTFTERKDLIETIYSNNEVSIVGVKDCFNWDEWFEGLKQKVKEETGQDISEMTLYYHNKDVDKTTFMYDGQLFKDTFYTDVFEYNDVKMKPIEFVDRTDFHINANGRDIRHNIDGFKHFIDGRIYHQLKDKGW